MIKSITVIFIGFIILISWVYIYDNWLFVKRKNPDVDKIKVFMDKNNLSCSDSSLIWTEPGEFDSVSYEIVNYKNQ